MLQFLRQLKPSILTGAGLCPNFIPHPPPPFLRPEEEEEDESGEGGGDKRVGATAASSVGENGMKNSWPKWAS